MESITTKLIIALTLCLAAILAVGMAVDYQLSREEILQRLRVESLEVVNGVVSDLEHLLQRTEGSTLLLSRILEQRRYSQEGLKQILRDVIAHDDDIYGATIALNPDTLSNPQGFAPYYYHHNGAIEYSDLTDKGPNYWRHSWYTEALKQAKPTWIEPYFDDGGGNILMTTFSAPVYHINAEGNRSLYAVVTADIALEKLGYYLRRLRLGDTGSAVLLSKAGIVLSSKHNDAVMQHYVDSINSLLDRKTWENSISTALAGQTVIFPTKCPSDPAKTCHTRLSMLTSSGWLVGVTYSEDELLAPLKEYQIKTIFIGLTTLLLMALTVGIVSRRLTRPLVDLAKASDAIATGDLNAPLPRVSGKDEVAQLVQSFGAMKRDLKSYIGDLEIATAGKARLEGEMAAATQIQMSMLPQGGEALEEADNYSLWAKVQPAKSVGGDLYTFYCRDKSKLYMAVGDVSDKGVPAALFMAKTISHMKQFEDAFQSPSDGMALLNNALEQGNDNCMFVTLFFGVLDLHTLVLHFASAGHTPPSLLRQGEIIILSQKTGPALGLAPDMTYPENTFSLAAGDRLAVYTDGIDEAFNEEAKMFGFERFNNQLRESGEDNIAVTGARIFQAVENFSGDTPQSDDITLMLLDLRGQAAKSQTFSRSFACDSSACSAAGEWLEELFQRCSIDDSTTMEMVLVSEEMLTNINKYAELDTDALIELSVGIYDDRITLEFSDPGVPFNPFLDGRRAALGNDIESAEIGGLGVHLVAQLIDRQSYRREEGRNLIRLEKSITFNK
ncbi:MAG: SpoIIE family protein phosphatase [Proteobacteria bacterium]|nr:SpoIIE family protein phosphatase [Pseudomonadota bacterium]